MRFLYQTTGNRWKIFIKITDMKKEEYTFDILLNDIQPELIDDNEKEKNSNIARREYNSKLIVIQMLIGLAELYKTKNYKDDEKLSNAIEIKVNGDELLSGYMFFVSQNSQFDYSWNYMRKRKANYKEFLTNSVRFLNNVLFDINILINKSLIEKTTHVIFHDIFDVRPIDEKPFVKTRLLWENFYRLTTVKSEYNISVKIKESLQQIGCRKGPSDMEKIIDAAIEIIKKQKDGTV